MSVVKKIHVIQEIENYLQDELIEAEKGMPGNLDKSEIQKLLTMYRFLPRREYGEDDVVIPSALVELELGDTIAFYFVAPKGGGLVTRVDGKPVQVITPQSPLGERLLGKKRGDHVQVEIRGKTREYRIRSIS